MGGVPHIERRDWYTAREVAARFNVDPETVRIAGRDKRIPAINAGTANYAQWRYPKNEIDALQSWPSPVPAMRLAEPTLAHLLEQQLAHLQTENRRLSEELLAERTGRALAEQQLTQQQLKLDELRRALAVFTGEPAPPEYQERPQRR